jgi:hypothetical protein
MSTPHDPDAALTRALHGAVEHHGPHALSDPLALRLALRASRTTLTPGEIDLLVAVAGSGAVDVLGAAGGGTATRDPGGSDPDGTALRGALRRALTGTGLDATDAERACRAFAQVMAGAPARRLHWDQQDGTRTSGAAAGPPRRRSGIVIAAVAVLVLVLAAAGVIAAVQGRAAPPPPDRYAVDQVAQRYRALGATLLDGAMRCAPVAPDPGELEEVDCTFGAWSTVLTSYDTPSRLAAAGELLAPAGGDHLREGRTTGPGGTVTFVEDATEDGGSRSTVHWDTTTPRPAGATVTTSALPMSELAGFLDSRGFAGVERPDVPGPQFRSGRLYRLASGLGRKTSSTCVVAPLTGRLRGAEEEVRCTYANGASARFARFRDLRDLLAVRDEYATELGDVPGTLRVGGWSTSDPAQGSADSNQLIEFVAADDGDAELYYDQTSSRCLGIVTHPDFTQEQLRTFFQLG